MATFGWDVIRNSDGFQKMSNADQDALARNYFTRNVAPDLTEGQDVEAAYNSWKSDNLPQQEGDRATPAPQINDPEKDVKAIKAIPGRLESLAKETGRVGAQTVANVINTPSDLANVGRVGYNAITGDNVAPFGNIIDVPASLKPTTKVGGAIADILPMLTPSGGAKKVAGKIAERVAESAAPASANLLTRANAVNNTVKVAEAATGGAVKTVRAASGNTEQPSVDDYVDEATQAIKDNPEQYSGKSVADVALQLRDAAWAGKKAQQAVLGSTMKAGAVSVPQNAAGGVLENILRKGLDSTAGRGAQVGLATGGSELAKQGVESAISGQDKFDGDAALVQTGLGTGLGVLGNIAGSLIKPGNAERIQKIKGVNQQEVAATTRLRQAENTHTANQQTAARFSYDPAQVSTGRNGEVLLQNGVDEAGNPLFVAADSVPLRNRLEVAQSPNPADGSQWFRINGSPIDAPISLNQLDAIHQKYFPHLNQEEFVSLPSTKIAQAIQKDGSAAAELKAAQDALPTISAQGMTKFAQETSKFNLKDPSTYLAPDLSKLSKDQREAIGLTGIAGLASKVGNIAESGLVNRLRAPAEAAQMERATAEGVNNIQRIQNLHLQSGSDPEGVQVMQMMIDSLKSGKAMPPQALQQVAKVSSRYEQAAQNAAPNLQADIQRMNPINAYRDARSAQEAIQGAAPERADTSAAGLLSTLGLGYVTGGLSSAAQVGAAGLKQIVDRGVLNDVRRAADLPVRGDATRQVVGDAVTSSVRPSANVASASLGDAYDAQNAPQEDSVDWESAPASDDVDWGNAPANPPAQSGSDVDWGEPEQKAQATKSDKTVGGKLYDAFKAAETGGESNPWIRTKGKDASSDLHSSAYGPIQITYSLAQDYLENHPDLFTEDEKDYLSDYVNQGKMMIAASNGYVNDPKLQYGGEGYLTGNKAKEMYEKVAKKMLVDTFRRNGGDLGKTISAWRGVDDPAYADKVAANIS